LLRAPVGSVYRLHGIMTLDDVRIGADQAPPPAADVARSPTDNPDR